MRFLGGRGAPAGYRIGIVEVGQISARIAAHALSRGRRLQWIMPGPGVSPPSSSPVSSSASRLWPA